MRKRKGGGPSLSPVSPTSVSARRTANERRQRRRIRHAGHFLHLCSLENAQFLQQSSDSEASPMPRQDGRWAAFEKRRFGGGGAPAPRRAPPLRWHSLLNSGIERGAAMRGSGGGGAAVVVVHMCSWRPSCAGSCLPPSTISAG